MPFKNKTSRQRDIFRYQTQKASWQYLLDLCPAIELSNTKYYVKETLTDDEYSDRIRMLQGQILSTLKHLKIPPNATSRKVLLTLFSSLDKSYNYRSALLAQQQFKATCLKRV